MGHYITKEGIVVDPEKVRAIWDIAVLETVGALRRFLSVTYYVGKFIPNLTTAIKALQDLTKLDVPWLYSGFQQADFNGLKKWLQILPFPSTMTTTRNWYLKTMLVIIAREQP